MIIALWMTISILILFVLFNILIVRAHHRSEVESETRHMMIRQRESKIDELEQRNDRQANIREQLEDTLHRQIAAIKQKDEHIHLIEEDFKKRIEEIRKQPTIACMTDAQVQVLAEMINSYLKMLNDGPKEYIQ